MQAIKCELCGSNQLIKKDSCFQCEHCGTKYTLEEAKKLIVSGTVEVVTGNAEKERLLKNAEAFYKLGEIEKALLLYKDIQDKFPEEARGWEGTLIIIANEGLCITEHTHYGVPYFYLDRSTVELNREFKRVFKNYENVSENPKNKKFFIDIYTKKFFDGLVLSGGGFAEVLLPETIINEGVANANLINELRLMEYLTDDYSLKYSKCTFCYADLLFYVIDDDSRISKTKKVVNNEYLNNLKNFRINNGLCLFCGGKFKFLRHKGHKVCKKCNAVTRVNHTTLSDGTKVRTCKKCNESLDAK